MNPKLLAFYNRLAKGEALTETECREIELLETIEIRHADPVLEKRYGGKLETRDGNKDKGELGIISGRPSNFGVLSHDLGGFKERSMPGCFSRSLASDEDVCDVRCLIGHNKDLLVARKSAGTLEIREDKDGLYAEVHTIDTTAGRDAWLNTRAGNYNAWSFGFKPKKVRWTKENGMMIRELLDVTLGEVTIVTSIPAYPDTSIAARELQQQKDIVDTKTTPRSVLKLRRNALELRYLSSDSPSPTYNSVQSQANSASYSAAEATRQARTGDKESHATAKSAHEKAAKLHAQAAKDSPTHHESVAAEHRALAKMHGSNC